MNTETRHQDRLPEHIRGYVNRRAFAAELVEAFRYHVHRVAHRYPAPYFPLGTKDEHSYEDLLARVFSTCDAQTVGRHPFHGQRPFLRYVEGLPAELRRGSEPATFTGYRICGWTFYFRWGSITRELLKRLYAENAARDPEGRRIAELLYEINRELQLCGEQVGTRDGEPLWRLDPRCSPEERPRGEALDELRARKEEGLDALVPLALELLGEATAMGLVSVLAELLPMPKPLPEAEAEDPELLLAVRRAVWRCWRELSEDERLLVRQVARGRTLREITEEHPRYTSSSSVGEGIVRCMKPLVERLRLDLAMEDRPPDLNKRLLERVGTHLLDCLPKTAEVNR